MLTFADIPEDAVFGDGKEGAYLKVAAFRAAPNGFRQHWEAHAWELDSKLQPESPAWFDDDCDELVYRLPGDPEQEAQRRLADLGGRAPDIQLVPRRRPAG